MKFPSILSGLLLALPTAVNAVFKDEVDHIDYHHQLVGIPQQGTTFFHRPRKTEKASLLYTLSDVGLIGAINPSNGEVVWRQEIASPDAAGRSYLRAGEGQGWLCSAYGHGVQSWDAIGGRSVWTAEFAGEVKDLEIMELTGARAKDVLVLLEEGDSAVVRRLSGEDGRVMWEFSETTGDIPLQVSTSVEKVFVAALHGSPGSYSLRVTVIDSATGAKTDDISIGSKDIASEKDVVYVGANSAAPIIAWTDAARSTLKLNVLGTKSKQEMTLGDNVRAVEIHAPHLVQSLPHFLVHTKTTTGHKADVYHVDLKSNKINHAYELPHLPGEGAFSTASIDTNVYFTRITNDQVIVTSSVSHGVLGRWDLEGTPGSAIHAVSEVVKKTEDSYVVRTAAVTADDDWVLIKNGEQSWARPEGMTGGIAAVFAPIPASESLAQNLEMEAHSNPIEAFIHRLKRHYDSLRYLPDWLGTIPGRLMGSVLGADLVKDSSLTRDSFGLHKLVVLATRRGKLYCLDTGNKGQIVWSLRAYIMDEGESWNVKGMFVEEHKGQVTVRGASGEQLVVRLMDGNILEAGLPGSWPPVQSTTVVTSELGQWLLPVGIGGKVGNIPAEWQPKERLVVRGENGELKGLAFPGGTAVELETWTFTPPAGKTILHIATGNPNEPVASIGRVLGDRSVLYKYLDPNTIVVATGDEAASTLAVYLLETVSGQILHSATYTGVDIAKPVECAVSENWFVCTFFGQFVLRENKSQSIKGWQLVVHDLYESEFANYRGPLGDAANFSAVDPVDSPTIPPLPYVISQAFVLGASMSALAVTQTRQGISTRQLLGYVPDTHSIIGLPRMVLEPRRVIGRDPNAQEKEEGLSKYSPAIEIDPRLVITHERDVLGVKEILAEPAALESTSLVFAYGVDVFGTRATPSGAFDSLGKGFNKVTLVMTVAALGVGVAMVGPMVRKKQIDLRWGGTG
ncbi:hypothetical protein MKZ38_001034 [Zalerion maritima]|uniref:ER membrane protein complex subunit 1 n=1 Tax=Zalerion maritima TaxID=339359 RepID=A0AAD5WRR4_9PEZI|nr:hypothetical protein MKZ38_001034 [Zalerion maritima]